MEFQRQMSLEWYCKESYRVAREHGFWDISGEYIDKHPPDERTWFLGTKLALVHSELSEALEAIRHGNQSNFEEEIADTFIRLFDLLEYIGMGSTIEKKIQEKMEINKKRPYKHGKQL